MSGEFGTGKTIFVLAIVVGCFAVLWPKIFYPMLTASVKSPASARQAPGPVGWKNQGNSEFLQQLCYLLEEHSGARWSHEAECWLLLESSCHLELNESMLEDYRNAKDKTSFTDCLSLNYGLSPNIVAAAVPHKVRPKSYTPQKPWSYIQGDLNSVEFDDDINEPWADLKATQRSKAGSNIIKTGGGHHVRPERPAHLYPEMMHPALREKGRAMPVRTIDKNPRPGPLPGMRPSMGGAGGIVPPPQGKGSGAMGIIMPLYTVGIVVFFVYTIMKVLFKKGSDDDKAPKLKDFGLDPEYRKYVFAEEYLDNQNISAKSEYRRQQREDSRQRRRMHEVPDTKIDPLLRPGQMDTGGKKLGEWYLPEGFLTKEDSEDDEFLDNTGGTSYEAMAETVGERLSKFKEEFHRENMEETGNIYVPKGFLNDYDNIDDEDIHDILKDIKQITGGLSFDEAMAESEPVNTTVRNRKCMQNNTKSSMENLTDSDIKTKKLLNFLRKGLDYADIDETERKRLTDLCELAHNVVVQKMNDDRIDEELEELDEKQEEIDYLDDIDDESQNNNITYEEDLIKDYDQKKECPLSQKDCNNKEDYMQKENEKCGIEHKDELLNYISEENMNTHYESIPTFCEANEDLPTTENINDQYDKQLANDYLNYCEEDEENIDKSYNDLLKYYQLSENECSNIEHDLQEENQQDNQYGIEREDEISNLKEFAKELNCKMECEKKDEQMDHLRQRLEDTELAMERLMNQMGSVTDKLTAAKITEVLSQAQAQAKILKDEAADLSLASEDDLTTSEALTTTISDESSFPSALHRHLQDLQNEENSASSKGSSPDMEEYEVINKDGVDQKSCKKHSAESSPPPTTKIIEESPQSTLAPEETEEPKKEIENKSSESASTTITSTESDHKDITSASQNENDEVHKNTIQTDESLSSKSPTLTQASEDAEKVEKDISDAVSKDESKKENLLSAELSSDDASPPKLVADEEENSIGKVEE